MGTIDGRCGGILQNALRLDGGRIDVRQLTLEDDTIDDDQRLVGDDQSFSNTSDISFGEMFLDGSFLFIAHLTLYGQIVYLQAVEPLGQRHLVGEVESQSLDVLQLGEVLRHSVHP